jgi:signal transduction histidine kinase
MTALLEDLLTIGKSESGKMKANIGNVELKHFLQGIIEEIHFHTHHTHHVQFDFPKPSLEIRSDAKLLRNIFINLLNNAITYSPGESEVSLFVTPGDSTVDITVKDTGVGIDEKDIDKIFEPFHRGSNTLGIKGTGLGLSIVKKAVEALDGKLFVKSKTGDGTLFTIRLNLKG